jgi:hypothetical protein
VEALGGESLCWITEKSMSATDFIPKEADIFNIEQGETSLERPSWELRL